MSNRIIGLLFLLAMWARVAALCAAEPVAAPKLGEFPPPNAGVYAAGELVAVDHVNRRGALRLIGDGVDGNYHGAASYRFALLPYGTVRYHGAPAELRDIPIGTVLHGYFFLPAKDEKAAPPANNTPAPQTTWQAFTLEDDFSFYQRQGQAWKITQIDVPNGKLKVVATGQTATDGLKGEQTFDFDASTRVWQGRQIAAVKDLAVDQVVQLNLTWAPDWQNGKFQTADLWLDAESCDTATELQRQVHIRHQRHRWLAGWVDHVEHQGGGRGIVTVTLFGGLDPTLYEAVRVQTKTNGGAALAAAEPTLRTWWQDHDSKGGPVVDCKDLPNPPPGSSGVQVSVQVSELLEGYRPGRIVRVRPNGFPNVKMPPEERVKSFEDR